MKKFELSKILNMLGYIYMLVFSFNTIFFYNQYLYNTPLSLGIFGVVAFGLILYKNPNANETLIFKITLLVVILAFVSLLMHEL